MVNLIEQYLAEKSETWSPTTARSEGYRLRGVAAQLNGNPKALWAHLKEKQSPYSRLTTWTRVTEFYKWAIEAGHKKGPNPYEAFRQKHTKLFQGAYQRRKPELSFEEARQRVESITHSEARSRAWDALHSGLRFAEATTFHGDGVSGKGGRFRKVYGLGSGPRGRDVPYYLYRRELARVGLKPHDLRKIFLSRLVELGANEFELCEVAGWSSIATASSYIKVNQSRVAALVKQVQEGPQNAQGEQIP